MPVWDGRCRSPGGLSHASVRPCSERIGRRVENSVFVQIARESTQLDICVRPSPESAVGDRLLLRFLGNIPVRCPGIRMIPAPLNRRHCKKQSIVSEIATGSPSCFFFEEGACPVTSARVSTTVVVRDAHRTRLDGDRIG